MLLCVCARAVSVSFPQMGNCLSCGKICCEMEAGTTCTFCGAVLTTIPNLGKKTIANVR